MNEINERQRFVAITVSAVPAEEIHLDKRFWLFALDREGRVWQYKEQYDEWWRLSNHRVVNDEE